MSADARIGQVRNDSVDGVDQPYDEADRVEQLTEVSDDDAGTDEYGFTSHREDWSS
ncbi:hypothetical protein [Williamsia sterculiae]|uniref:Uncharacterized protein n=1 Tax=Williamsia sterculiae TaxID=1344003 RepID=A0A1N7CAQ5_9NOCA|nr:hypothetical protein [Williamsia sterculiae]SIR60695.1 hypothetical protein SAMN05445060_0008 [Williamsia sterculiae]